MAFLQQLARGAEFRAGFQNPGDWLFEALGGSKTHSGQTVNPEKSFSLGPVFAAVSIISETIGMLPLKVYRESRSGEKTEARNHRCYRMLHDQPNSITPAHRFWSTVTAHLLLWGNAFLEKGFDPLTGLVDELWLLHPGQVTIKSNGREKMFEYQDGMKTRRLSDEQVVHIMGPSLDGIVGQSAIRCRQLVGTAMAREEYEGTFYKQGAVLRGVIEHPGRVSRKPEDLEKMRRQWRVAYGGSAGNDTAILEDGATFKPLSMPLRDLQFLENQQLTRTDIAIIFRIPPSFLGGSTGDSLTYATVEANQTQFAQLAIVPWTNVIAKTLASDPGVFPQSVNYPEFVVEALLRADAKSRAEYWTKLHDLGVVDAAYIAARENLPPPPEPKPMKVIGNGAGVLADRQGADALEGRLQPS